jgi:anti-anti-sigma regulatory factor
MLKISIKESKTRRLLILEGKLIEPWTDELKTLCQGPAIDLGGREIVIDLRGVTDMSAEGEETLLCLMVQSARFRGGGVYTKQVLKRLARRVRPDKNT